ncbi:MAG: type II toxin-antitoxin system VapC family toxin [Balneolaceae bacterium]|nr:type II toxin-antitoxin system VapC family toxin [Balneolaceae bacterium]
MKEQVLVDTDILIDFGRDKTEAVDTMAYLENEYTIAISVIVAMELCAGCRSKKELNKIEEMIKDFTLLHITSPISEKAYDWMKKYRSKHGVEINDMLIASTAQYKSIKLISKNQKHYKFLPDLELLEYPLEGV